MSIDKFKKTRFEIDNKVRDEYIYLQIVSLLTKN